MAWSCTPGRFEWHYAVDETVHIISGEACFVPKATTYSITRWRHWPATRFERIPRTPPTFR
jgi:hypothetical protein